MLSRWVDLSKASEPEIKQLSQACQPAAFGQGQQNVHDESYRKAGKLDVSDFATGLSVERSGLVDIIRSELLEGRGEGLISDVEVELYKLNVYGEFFHSYDGNDVVSYLRINRTRKGLLLQGSQGYSTWKEYVRFPCGRVPYCS
jgi:hypothetical protein